MTYQIQNPFKNKRFEQKGIDKKLFFQKKKLKDLLQEKIGNYYPFRR